MRTATYISFFLFAYLGGEISSWLLEREHFVVGYGVTAFSALACLAIVVITRRWRID